MLGQHRGGGTAQGNTITWTRGGVTYLATAAFDPKGPIRRAKCSSLADRYSITDQVAGDTTGSMKVGGKVSGDVCIVNEAPDAWSLTPGSKLKIR